MPADKLIIAIDGPSGVGKTTIARMLAAEFALPCLETGAMYRALGWMVLRQGVDPTARAEVEKLASDLELELREQEGGRVEILLSGRPLDSGVRSPEVSKITSIVSSYGGVRRVMVQRQRAFAESRGAVIEGRDIGTKVFPKTPHKFFLTAPQEVRVARRVQQLESAGQTDLELSEIEDEVAERDARDQGRTDSPLKPDASYCMVDTGGCTADEVVSRISELVRSRRQAEPSP